MSANSNLFDGLALSVMQRFGQWPTGRVLLVTSARPGEGKSFVSRRLARTMAGMVRNRVILVDANAANPSLAKAPDGSGIDFFDCIASGALIASGPRPTGISGLYAMPAARSASKGRLVYRTDGTARVLDALRASFDLTIIDGGSISEVGSLALQADATIVIVDASRTRRDVVKGSLAGPHVDRERIMGVVLNRRPEYVPQWIYRNVL